MDSLSEAFEALFMEGLYRFALQCVCKIERLFSVECNSYYVFRGGDLCSCLAGRYRFSFGM